MAKIEKSKIPLILQKPGFMREQILINPWISQYTRMKSQKYYRNLRIDKDFTKYIEDLMQYSETDLVNLSSKLMNNVNVICRQLIVSEINTNWLYKLQTTLPLLSWRQCYSPVSRQIEERKYQITIKIPNNYRSPLASREEEMTIRNI